MNTQRPSWYPSWLPWGHFEYRQVGYRPWYSYRQVPIWRYIPPRRVEYVTYEKITDPEKNYNARIYCAYTWNPSRAAKRWKYGKHLVKNVFDFTETIDLQDNMDMYLTHLNETGIGDDWRERDPIWSFQF